MKGRKNMERIASFCVDHRCLERAMYTSRVDGDITTYDIRMKKPNQGDYLAVPAMHTIEHLFATFARSSRFGSHVIYVGPMGCRTGFYLLVRDLSPEDSIALAKESMEFIADYDGEIPGATEPECGNWKEQDLAGAKVEAKEMASVLKNWTKENLAYKKYL